MPKSFPVVEVKCSKCSAVTSVQVEYEDEAERWGGAKIIFFPDEHPEGWQIGKTAEEPDYCPKHIPKAK